MNKKFLSAILFGALMVTSTGTFVSCKDYDDDIENLQGQISANASAIAELKTLVQNGDYVTDVTVNGQNLVVTTKNGGSKTIALPECEDEVGSVCKVEGGVLYIDGVATDIKVCESSEENDFQEPVKIENGYWTVLQEDGTYKSTGILASSITAVQNADESWVLTIKDAEGNAQVVEVPSASSLVTSLSIANPTFATIDLAAPYVLNPDGNVQMMNVAGAKYPALAMVSPLNANGTRGVYVDVLVEPVNIDPADLTFKLVNSKGQTVFGEGVVYEAPTLTRSTSNGVYRVYFAYADGVTPYNFAELYGYAAQNHALAVVCGKASTKYEIKNTYNNTWALTSAPTVTFYENYVQLGASYNLFGNGWSTNPTSTPNGYANRAFLNTFTNVTDVKLSVDSDIAAAYGVTVDGYNFTISGEAAYGKRIPLNVTYTGSNSTNPNGWTTTSILYVNVQTKPINMGATLSASHVLSVNTANSSAAMYAYIPLANLANSITGENKIAWNDATTLTYAVVNANNTTTSGLNLTSTNKHNYAYRTMTEGVELTNISLVKSDKSTAAANLASAAYIKVMVVPTSANVAVDTYKANIEFTFAGKKAYADVELTLTNPTTLTRIPSLFNGDNVIAYGVGNNGAGEIFDVKSLYETVGAQYDNFRVTEVQTVSGLANWTVANADDMTIATSTMYKDARKVKVQWEVFAGATNNSFTDVIYVVAQSPIYDGTVTTSKTTLSLGQSKSAVFTDADFTAKDVWGNAYHMFAYQYVDGKDANGDPIYKWANFSDSKIQQPVTVTADSDLVEVTMKTVGGSGTYAASQKGFTVKVKESAAIQTGATINITIKFTDDWGKEKSIPVTLTVVE